MIQKTHTQLLNMAFVINLLRNSPHKIVLMFKKFIQFFCDVIVF